MVLVSPDPVTLVATRQQGGVPWGGRRLSANPGHRAAPQGASKEIDNNKSDRKSLLKAYDINDKYDRSSGVGAYVVSVVGGLDLSLRRLTRLGRCPPL